MGELVDFILNNIQQFKGARVASLYSDFRQLRTSNPEGYAANVQAWLTALTSAAREGYIASAGPHNNLLVLNTGEELLQALETRQWGRPLALGTVIKESVERKEIIPFQDFSTRSETIHDKTWNITPWRIFIWSLRQLGLTGGLSGEDKLPVGRFVLLSNVEEAAHNVLRGIPSRDLVDRVYSRDFFRADFNKALNPARELTELDFEVLLTYLTRDKKAILYDGQTIRFRGPGDTSTSITTQDSTIAALKALIADQSLQVSTLTERIDLLGAAARTAVKNQNKISALAALRSKKLAETTLSRRSEMLTQLEEVLSNIRQAADQVEMVKVMESSAKVLKSLHKEVGGVERVEDVVEELREQMAKTDEISTVVNEIGQINAGDEAEVDDELEALEREQEEERAKKEEAETWRRLKTLDDHKENITTTDADDRLNQDERTPVTANQEQEVNRSNEQQGTGTIPAR